MISEGDLIQSNTYSPNRELHFYLLGEFRKSCSDAMSRRVGIQGCDVARLNAAQLAAHPAVAGTLN